MVHNPEISGGRVGCTLFHAKNNVFYRVGGVLRGLPPRRIVFQQRKTTFGLVSSETVLFILTSIERSERLTISSQCVSRGLCQRFTGSKAGGERWTRAMFQPYWFCFSLAGLWAVHVLFFVCYIFGRAQHILPCILALHVTVGSQ